MLATLPDVSKPSEFTEWLITQMADRAVTRRELQRRTGMSKGAVDRWFHGASPRQETVNTIAQALGADVLEAQRAAGHIAPLPEPRNKRSDDVPPLTDDEIATLREFLSIYEPERLLAFRRIGVMLGDVSPAAWTRLRRMADALDED